MALVAVVLLSGNSGAGLAQARSDLAERKVGSITLTACDEVTATAVTAWCGSLPMGPPRFRAGVLRSGFRLGPTGSRRRHAASGGGH